ncbi:MAG: hypothetical protein HKN12_04120, partial [Gemmatimonadetes bacterium]|nr:hypothetical protein [Gemmatimonadota bacterium]
MAEGAGPPQGERNVSNLKDTVRRAQALVDLHGAAELLVLPNVWNPVTARILQGKGFPAVATASASIAEALGYG